MANKPTSDANGYTFKWKIKNISHCWKKKGEGIVSPFFIADALAATKWSLRLYPIVEKIENVDVYLYRAQDCNGPHTINVSYQLSLLDNNGKLLIGRTSFNASFDKNWIRVPASFARETVFVTEKEAYLPEDTLTVQCELWKKEEALVKSKHVFARTVFKVNQQTFVWKIDEFSSLNSGVRNKFKDNLIDFDIVSKEGLDREKKLVIDGISFDTSIKYFSFKTSIINSEGEKEDYGRHEYFANDLKRGVSSTLLFTKKLMENKDRYLPQDVLSLDCNYIYSTGTIVDEFCCRGVISSKVTKVDVDGRDEHSVKQRDIQLTPALANDLKSMYSDGVFSDTKLRTSTQTFPAHKTILCARSPVFRRMFSIDMIEKSSGYIDIDDLEDDTIHRMLLYIYTDSLEDLQLDSACKLYAAAEKYQILSLKSRCSSFLKDNLISTKACDVLILSDLHQDEDLRNAVQDFILKHDKEVFGSEQWKHLMANNIQLAANVMYRKYSI